MSDESSTNAVESSSTPAPPSEHSESSSSDAKTNPVQSTDRAGLVSRARLFLASPHIQQQDIQAKQRFLAEKGLTESEINEILKELPHIPFIPPRTYPQPPQSSLPILLLGLARLFSWIAGGSAVVMFIYHRFLLPRLIESANARKAIRSHQTSLFQSLTASLTLARAAHAETLSTLPRSNPNKEPESFSGCCSIQDLLRVVETRAAAWTLSDLPTRTLLRCAIADYVKVKPESKPTTEDLFMLLQGKLPQLIELEDGPAYQQTLWETLSTSSMFISTPPDMSATSTWSFVPAELPPIPPLLASISTLRNSLPKQNQQVLGVPRQNVLQTLSEFTGYISSQLYRMPYRVAAAAGSTTAVPPIEEDLKREIRALKGLVLNRRSFLPPKHAEKSLSLGTS